MFSREVSVIDWQDNSVFFEARYATRRSLFERKKRSVKLAKFTALYLIHVNKAGMA